MHGKKVASNLKTEVRNIQRNPTHNYPRKTKFTRIETNKDQHV